MSEPYHVYFSDIYFFIGDFQRKEKKEEGRGERKEAEREEKEEEWSVPDP